MSNHLSWRMAFPAISPGGLPAFLNNRDATQIPADIRETLMHAFNAGVVREEDHTAAQLRQKLATFLHVSDPETFFFTESEAGIMHWLAYSWGFSQLQDGDEVIYSSQDAPMIKETVEQLQQQMTRLGLSLVSKEFAYKDNGEFDLDGLLSLLSARTRLILVPHIHPVFGTKNADDIAVLKQQLGDQGLVVVDLSQSVGRIPANLERLRCDCAFFSARNLFSPFPSGVGYIRHRPCADLFLKQEPATALATQTLAQGIDLLEHIGMEQIARHLQDLSRYLLTRLQQIAHIEFLPGIGWCEQWCSPGYGILSFRLPGVSAEECVMHLAENALLVHQADMSHDADAITVSAHLYTTREQIDALVDGLQQLYC